MVDACLTPIPLLAGGSSPIQLEHLPQLLIEAAELGKASLPLRCVRLFRL